MGDEALSLSVLPDRFGICRLDPDDAIPPWAIGGSFFSVTRSPEELSVVCVEAGIPEGTLFEGGWRCLMVHGPLDFSLTGVLSSLTVALADAGISLLAASTYDTDYILVRESDLGNARSVLSAAGHHILDRE